MRNRCSHLAGAVGGGEGGGGGGGGGTLRPDRYTTICRLWVLSAPDPLAGMDYITAEQGTGNTHVEYVTTSILTSKEKHSLMRKLVGCIGIGGKGGVKRKGTRFWEKKNPIFSMCKCNRTKRSADFCLIFLFQKSL